MNLLETLSSNIPISIAGRQELLERSRRQPGFGPWNPWLLTLPPLTCYLAVIAVSQPSLLQILTRGQFNLNGCPVTPVEVWINSQYYPGNCTAWRLQSFSYRGSLQIWSLKQSVWAVVEQVHLFGCIFEQLSRIPCKVHWMPSQYLLRQDGQRPHAIHDIQYISVIHLIETLLILYTSGFAIHFEQLTRQSYFPDDYWRGV